jgi:flagellar biosynthesis protein FlhF
MNVKTYRAKTMQEALALVRSELGSQASVLRTREVRPRGLSRLWNAPGLIEVVASVNVSVPSRLPSRQPVLSPRSVPAVHAGLDLSTASVEAALPRQSALPTAAHAPSYDRRAVPGKEGGLPVGLSCVLAELVASGIDERFACDLVERVRRQHPNFGAADSATLMRHLAESVESELPITGPLQVAVGRRRTVALVGPTGVGKTTTIAKLAAHYRLHEKRRVGLITVDTYRIAAVEQLRTYAEILDLPMEIAATPADVHGAVSRMPEVDLILLDTAGRSPHDEGKIKDLKSLLAEAAADEVHLVLSSAASGAGLSHAVEQFATAGVTALLLTKLDEAVSLGSLYNLARRWRVPFSYLTHGQNVPTDIVAAERRVLARAICGLQSITQN